MKIGILTHPLHTNYGGILQAYALQTVLEKQGHDVSIINREYEPKKNPFLVSCKVWRHKLLNRYIFNCRINCFIQRYIHRTKKLENEAQFEDYIKKANYDVIVVGSDQVWRPKYSPNIYNYFLNVTKNIKLKRIAYAASFGVDEWEFSEDETKECSALAKQFTAISVREQSGIELCKRYLGVDAKIVLDPTLLLDKDFYIKLARGNRRQSNTSQLFCYLLDNNTDKLKIASDISKQFGYTAFFITSKEGKKQKPSVSQWIRCFIDAEMVFTDYFHGTVFSIIFNKPFWIIGNEERGMSRFKSLLSLLGLEDRLIKIEDEVNYNNEIDWLKVNNQLKELRLDSLSFLFNAINL